MTCHSNKKGGAGGFPPAVLEIINPEQLVLLRKVIVPATMPEADNPPAVGKYRNVILKYEDTGNIYIYSSDGIPTAIEANVPQEILDRIDNLDRGLANEIEDRTTADANLGDRITDLDNSLATVAKSGSYTDLSDKPTVGDGTLTIQKNSTNVGTFTANATTNATIDLEIPVVDSTMSTSSSNPVENSAISNKLNKNVMTDISLSANASTTTVQIDGAKENLYTGVTSTKNVALPVASATQAGVMNSATFDAVTANTNNLNAIMNGAVAITGLSASPSQSDLTTAWQTETGLSTLINRASIYDVTNNKVWTYYTNDATWHAASNTSQVSISTFTNSSEGTIKGSTNVGQVFAENDGTGSVNGWDTLSGAVSTNTSDIASLRAAIPTVNNATLTIQNNGTDVATFTANSSTNTTANIVPPVQIGSVSSSQVAQLTDKDSNNIFPIAGGTTDAAITSNMFAQYAANKGILTANNLTPATDTTTAWITLLGGPFGSGKGGYWATYYNQSNCFTSQPDQYGWLETIIEGTGIYQRFTVHATGRIFYRMGNATGWWSVSGNAGVFREVFDKEEIYSQAGATEIYGNADLNTINYAKPGKYFCRTSTTASTLTNCPVSMAFSMEVINITGDRMDITSSSTWTYLIRILTDYQGNVYTQYVDSNGDNPPAWSYSSWTPRNQLITVTSTDPGEGATLAANHFIAVYS